MKLRRATEFKSSLTFLKMLVWGLLMKRSIKKQALTVREAIKEVKIRITTLCIKYCTSKKTSPKGYLRNFLKNQSHLFQNKKP